MIVGKEQEMAELLGEVGQVVRVVLDELREGGLLPSPAQWARARALSDAEAWVEHVTAGSLDVDQGPTSVEAQVMIEAITQRWGKLIEDGVAR